jgi:cytochrome P450
MMAIFDKYLFYLTHVGIYASLHPYLFRCVQFLQSLGKKTAESGKNFTQQFIDTRVLNPDSEASHRDFLTRLLEVQRDNPEKLSTTDIFMACQINVGAGSDTTGISLSAVFYYLLKNPHAMRLLQEEIDYSGAPGPISFADAQKMPYLQAVIKEALRLHPAVGLGLPRVVPKGGAVLAGRFFPEDVS